MKNAILIGALNWGLGHATRCIPIIRELMAEGFEPHIAGDGMALELLRKEFPELISHELPSYHISYPRNAKNFKLKLIVNTPTIIKAIKGENKVVKQLSEKYKYCGIISDNRLGVRYKNIPSVIITHQLKVLSGATSWFSTKIHQDYINKFDECWVPDFEDEPGLSGELGHDKLKIPTKYMGALSRFTRRQVDPEYDLMVLLSGPEPQRQLLEDQLLIQLKAFEGKILFVRGVVEEQETSQLSGQMTVKNYMYGSDLEYALNASKLILSRSGYTTILDLCRLQKKAFFIPTPGQFEQEYLAKRLEKNQIIPSCNQDEFDLNQLERVNDYSGFEGYPSGADLAGLFGLFKSK